MTQQKPQITKQEVLVADKARMRYKPIKDQVDIIGEQRADALTFDIMKNYDVAAAVAKENKNAD